MWSHASGLPACAVLRTVNTGRVSCGGPAVGLVWCRNPAVNCGTERSGGHREAGGTRAVAISHGVGSNCMTTWSRWIHIGMSHGRRYPTRDHLGWPLRLLTTVYRLGQAARSHQAVACHCLTRHVFSSHDARSVPALPAGSPHTLSRWTSATRRTCVSLYPRNTRISPHRQALWTVAAQVGRRSGVLVSCQVSLCLVALFAPSWMRWAVWPCPLSLP
jgi:hypothetical protein